MTESLNAMFLSIHLHGVASPRGVVAIFEREDSGIRLVNEKTSTNFLSRNVQSSMIGDVVQVAGVLVNLALLTATLRQIWQTRRQLSKKGEKLRVIIETKDVQIELRTTSERKIKKLIESVLQAGGSSSSTQPRSLTDVAIENQSTNPHTSLAKTSKKPRRTS